MTIKYYRKKGTDKATHESYFHSITTIGFGEINTHNFKFYSDDCFDQFLEENDFEEVMDDSTMPESKLHLGEKVDRALVKDVKLPEVGKRYKNKKHGRIMEVYSFGTERTLYRYRDALYLNDYLDISTNSFWDQFEEHPEDCIEKIESIWKYPSELGYKPHYGYLKSNDGQIIPAHYSGYGDFTLVGDRIKSDDPRVAKFCTLTDYMNSVEQRLNKLEGK